jgi:hypothetical protein
MSPDETEDGAVVWGVVQLTQRKSSATVAVGSRALRLPSPVTSTPTLIKAQVMTQAVAQCAKLIDLDPSAATTSEAPLQIPTATQACKCQPQPQVQLQSNHACSPSKQTAAGCQRVVPIRTHSPMPRSSQVFFLNPGLLAVLDASSTS